MCNISEFKGKTLRKVEAGRAFIEFWFDDGSHYQMYHVQDCCENVMVEDIDSPLDLLVGHEILVAEERMSHDEPPEGVFHDTSFTWTFYTLRTMYASSTIRWFGSSNGYYSERVSVVRIA